MMFNRNMFVVIALSVVLGQQLRARDEAASELPRLTEEARALSLLGIDGDKVSPLACGDGVKVSVVIFSTVDCPIANAFQPTIGRLAEAYSDLGVSFCLVHVDPDVDFEAAKEHAAEYGIKIPVVIDSEHALVAATGVTLTPEAVVAMPDGKVIYRGRINDLYTDLGVRRRAPRTRELADAIEAGLAGKLPEVREAAAVGCIIADFRKVQN